MGQSQKPRKKYRPKVGVKDTVTTLFEGDEPLKGELKDKVLLTTHMAALALSKGEATQDDWGALVTACNVCLVLCEQAKNKHIGLQAVYDASNALISVQERFFAMGRRVSTGDELTAVNGGIHVFEELVETVSKRKYVWASDQIEKRMRDGQVVGVAPMKKTVRYAFREAA